MRQLNFKVRQILGFIFLFTIFYPHFSNAWTPISNWRKNISLLAGGLGGSGNLDGTGVNARLAYPTHVAVDTVGNIYCSDNLGHTIRKITPLGVVTTFAGTKGVSGTTDGTGTAAKFNGPNGIAIDSAGNLFVADTGNQTIRKITPAGVVTTFAGTVGVSGSTNGTGLAAKFNNPSGLSIDNSDNIYIADVSNHTIRKMTSAGVVTTLAGLAGTSGTATGTGSTARFNNPFAVYTDAAGANIYVADTNNQAIRKVTSAGVVTNFAGLPGTGGSIDGTGTAARFAGPAALSADSSGNLFVLDSSNYTIRKITPGGVVTTFAGTALNYGHVDATGAAARFYFAKGLTVNLTTNDIYVGDYFNTSIRKITSAGVVTTFAGASAKTGTTDGTRSAAKFGSSIGGLAMDSAKNLYVADSSNHSIRKVTPAGVVTTFAGTAGSQGTTDATGTAAKFNYPYGIVIDSSGNLFVADSNSQTIRKITPAGVVTTFAGTSGSTGTANGTGAAARFNTPRQMAIDSSDNIYVADTFNSSIRKITPAGVVTTLAGTSGSIGSTDGTGSAALFKFPSGIAIDPSENYLYVGDTSNHSIRKISLPGAVVTTWAGTVGVTGSTDSVGTLASFYSPTALAVDKGGNVFVVDSGNYLIRKINPAQSVKAVMGRLGTTGVKLGNINQSILNNPSSILFNSGKLYLNSENSILKATAP
jgi:sugar lactone lactonase YvrE